MSQLEIKGQLAKLLATENLIVQHTGTVDTASFNTATRVLTLPILDISDPHVYDMFIGHEVGHALYTPVDWRDQVDPIVPFDYVNVIEDVRIERMIQDKFPGLRKDFSQGYRTLDEEDFFDILGKDLSKLSLIDRINLHFKLGELALIPFSEEEKFFVDLVANAETFNDVCHASQLIAIYAKAKRDEAEASDAEGESGADGPESDQVNAQNSAEGEAEPDSGDDELDDFESPAGGPLGEDEAETQKAFDKNMKRQIDKSQPQVHYLETPDEKIDIYPLEFLRDEFREAIAECNQDLSRIREEYNRFLTSIRKDVTFMVQQFEMKKSASAYARTQINKTGVLDTEKLHLYKLSDDVFLRQAVTPNGKNHGLVMLVDWSGSMSDNIVATVKQLIVMVQFCRKVGIPFDVYTFTCSGYSIRGDKPLEPNKVSMNFNANVVHILSSSAKRREIDEDLFHIYNQAKKISYTFSACVHVGSLVMGGTPLNNVLFMVPDLIEDFKRKTGSEKVSFVCLTDGESSPLHYNQECGYGVRIGMMSPYSKCFLRDGRQTYQIDLENETTSIVQWLKQKLSDVSITNIYLSGPKGFQSYYRRLMHQTIENIDHYRKTGAQSFTMKTGWPLVCVLNPNSFRDAQDEIQVEDGATKAQIRSALRKFLRTKSVSKLILTQLVEQLA